MSSEKFWLHTNQLKKIFLACLSSFVISEVALAHSISALRRDNGTSGDIEVFRRHTPHSSSKHGSNQDTRNYQAKDSAIHSPTKSVGVVFFAPTQNYHQIPSLILCFGQVTCDLVYYIMQFLIIVPCRTLMSCTVRILCFINTPGMEQKTTQLGKKWQRKI